MGELWGGSKGGPHKGVLIAIPLVLPWRAAPAVVAAVNTSSQVASFGSSLCSALHLVHIPTCTAC